MSLYGALFGGVSGLRAQSSKIGAISDNIANVNTVGYKQATGEFETLVVNSSSTGTYQTGGVRGSTRLAVSKQGLLSSTDAPTDIAMSGSGFFVVRAAANADSSDTAATPLFTRAGSFRQDALGNFVNAQGFFLQGWPLDRNGQLPGEGDNINQTSSANFDSLETVNVESASGVAQATSLIELGANLDAGETVFPGEGVTGTPDTRATANAGINAEAIIVGDEYGFATQNNLHRGDMFEVISSAGTTTYLYGGYTVGRNITIAGAGNYGDGNTDNTAVRDIGTALGNIEVGPGGNTYRITLANHGMITGDQVELAGFIGAMGATPIAELNTTHTVTVDSTDPQNTFLITVNTPHGGAAGTDTNPGGITAETRQFSGNILNANSAGSTFLGGSTPSTTFSAAALTFTIATSTMAPVTFSYTNTSPNVFDGQFNSLTTLASAINEVNGLSARVAGGRLVVSSEDPAESVTFTNGDIAGDPTNGRRGIDWVSELGLANVPLPSTFPGTETRRFNSMQSLADIVNADPGLSASISNPLAAASIEIRVDDPSANIQVRDLNTLPTTTITTGSNITVPAGPYGSFIDIVINNAPPAGLSVNEYVNIADLNIPGAGLPNGWPNGTFLDVVSVNAGDYTVRIPIPTGTTINPTAGNYPSPAGAMVSVIGRSNQGSILGALGIADGDGTPTTPLTGTYSPIDTGTLGPRYDVTGNVGDNMASGDITAQFSRNIRIYDSLGAGHDVRFSVIKIGDNSWAAELHAIPETDISSTLPDGQIATGTINFNGDGSLRSVSNGLTGDININWTNGAVSSTITLGLGTQGQPFGTPNAPSIGLTDGLSQFDSSYNVAFANQNGAPVGQLVSVSINEEGQVIASYSNGETQALYQLPIADFPNPDGLRALSGNVYSQTRESGEVNLREAGTNGTGTVVSGALEQSNVDLAEQLTDMIVAQRAYQANTRVIRTTDELLEQLNQL